MKRVSSLFDKYMRESLFAKVGFAVEFRAKTKLGLGVLRRGEEVFACPKLRSRAQE